MCHTTVHGNVSGFGTLTFRSDSDGTIHGDLFAADLKLQRWAHSGGKYVLDETFVDEVTSPNLVAEVLPGLIPDNLISVNGSYQIKKGEKHNTFENVRFVSGSFYTMTHNEVAKRDRARQGVIRNPFTNKPVVTESDFPPLDFSLLKNCSKGKIILGDGTVLSSPISGNRLLLHGQNITTIQPDVSYRDFDVACPPSKTLTVEGEVVVEGDLVLAGCIKGKGSIYANGNIYIPDDIKNVRSAFPYTLTVDERTLASEARDKSDADFINLGAREFIVAGPIRFEVIGHEEQDAAFRDNKESIERVFRWLSPQGVEANRGLYANQILKRPFFQIAGTGGGFAAAREGAVALIEANLYANKGIAHTLTSAWASNIVINGSVMTPNVSLLSSGFNAMNRQYAVDSMGNRGGIITTNPFNGKSFDQSYIHQDFRLKYTEDGFVCHRVRDLQP